MANDSRLQPNRVGFDVRMRIKRIAGTIVGAFFALLGLLWLLQGVGLLQVCPIACVGSCECITGGSVFWAVAGAIVLIAGVGIVMVSWRRFGTSPESKL